MGNSSIQRHFHVCRLNAFLTARQLMGSVTAIGFSLMPHTTFVSLQMLNFELQICHVPFSSR